jgi:hypothetical protein
MTTDQTDALQIRRDSVELARERVRETTKDCTKSGPVPKSEKSFVKSLWNKLFGQSSSPATKQRKKPNSYSVELILRKDDRGIP